MPEQPNRLGTQIGHVTSVRGGLVQVRLRETPTTLVMVDGSVHRVGQIGAFARIPMGYTQLYGIVVQVGADSLSQSGGDADQLVTDVDPEFAGYRWMTIALFGEATVGVFGRGVSQYPTVGDEVHLTTARDLETIYMRSQTPEDLLTVGTISGSESLAADLTLSRLVSRHSCIVGSTGAGKSNLVAVILAAIADPRYSAARALVIDPHGEYIDAVPGRSTVIRTGVGQSENALRVPYWALPFDDLLAIAMGPVPERDVEYIRERVRALKAEGSQLLTPPPPPAAVTADSPVPFSIRRLWFELIDAERVTFSDRQPSDANRLPPSVVGDAETLTPPEYPAASAYNTAPYLNSARRNLGRQLDFMRSRLTDSRFQFLFQAGDGWHPDHNGGITKDLDVLLASWVGGPEPVTILDVSGLPAETVGIVVGTMLNIIYDALFWAMGLEVGGKKQPLLVIVDEAHRFLPAGAKTPASRACSRISREGRKYGVSLMTVTQRPSDIDPTILSQAGTMLALRVTNGQDRSAVASAVPDDLGGLTDLLPSLRTGEGLVLGEALAIPSRVRFHRASASVAGDDPVMPGAWIKARPDESQYGQALMQWRSQSAVSDDTGGD